MSNGPQCQLKGNDSAHVWLMSLDLAADRITALRENLSPDEQSRCSRFVIQKVRDRFIAARGQLREILASYLSCAPAEIAFRYGEHGKPLLNASPQPPLQFNLSHSGEHALVAVTMHAAIGIDIEQLRSGRPLLKLAERFFSARESAELRSLPEQLQEDAFYACWTRKEAYLKAIGTGLATPLNAFDVTLLPGMPPALAAQRLAPEETVRWQLVDIAVPGGYRGALAACREMKTLLVRRWPLA
ncbi:MAG: 4'-phosphopantetheinyl transferase superfamily protein [Geobacter sp.]|nr:4'-phosphopantetheinyl transferase superfamily protein [Geobacter sp.]